MSSFSFETITSTQALNVASTDTVMLSAVLPTAATVLYDAADPNITIIAGANTVVFGPAIEALSMAGGLRGADGSTLYIGDGGANGATLGATNDAMFGGAGDDSLDAGEGNNLLQGNTGADMLSAGFGNDTVYGGQDNDQIHVGEGTNFAQGNKGDDSITAGTGPDTLLGGQGNDTIVSGTTAFGADGANFLNGNLGNDVIHAGNGNDQVFGEDGNDTLDAGYGDNFVDGGNGDDMLTAGLGSNTMSGGAGNDTLESDSARISQLDGGDGDDQIFGAGLLTGGDGNDTINGSANDDPSGGTTVNGGAGDDLLKGGNGADSLVGGDGNDTLLGNSGADMLSGGDGRDVFQFRAGDGLFGGVFPNKHDSIVDWTPQDQLMFANGGAPNSLSSAIAGTSANYVEVTATDVENAKAVAAAQMAAGMHYVAVQVGADVVVTWDEGSHVATDGVFLIGRNLADIDFSNIIGA